MLSGLGKKLRKVAGVIGSGSNPAILARMGWRAAQYFFLRKKNLVFIEFALSYRCNARCRFCSSSRDVLYSGQESGELTLEQIRQALRGARRAGAISVSFSGGEPTIHRDILEIVSFAKGLGILPAISTNGSTLTPAFLDRLKAAGLSYLCCSLHGEGEAHDRILGIPGLFDKVMAGLEYARRIGISTGASVTITHDNIAIFPRLAEITSQRGMVLGYNYSVPVGLWGGTPEVMLSLEEQEIIELVRRQYEHVSNDYDSYFQAMTCPAGAYNIYISPRGDVLPCPYIQISFGNLLEEPLPAIYARMCSAEVFRRSIKGCPAGQHVDFVRDYISPVNQGGVIPLPYKSHPRFATPGSHGLLR